MPNFTFNMSLLTIERKNRLKSWALLLLWGSFLFFNSQYRHLHFDSQGNLISHSHYSGDNQSNHQHSQEDFDWLDIISNPLFDAQDAVYLELFLPITAQSNLRAVDITFIPEEQITSYAGRAPPVLS
jgi:hypothetical protein